ncbi:MAG: GtrA family protein [Alphaproteobacteria bacterium]
MTINDILERHRETARQFFKFGIIGAMGFLVDWGMLEIGIDVLNIDRLVDNAALNDGIHFVGLGRIAAGLFSFPFAVTATWIGNRHFTFRDAPPMRAAKQLAKFAVVCAVGLVFNRGTYSLLIHYVPFIDDYPVIGLLGGTGIGMFFNFFAARRHVFGM